ncbi:hypothetical protein CAOG_03456 [Capsaspora owczarzaki ATCC 30864]|uniref:NAD(P)-binding domain-containing protein n=1 Tax=Capsaspora owczarzaki (strain ATCC 30864) TaxID=595528 RepID=A0A0D2WN82_CAPO3|nr:hypothetical protein CAOG_03456 [Capsaspora owczarzaki ATCC 30864]KJE92500.1 hypothetical protein CAOG_003456 [Capsaspora owczarzaki ATCC 30864]|eukprot:XP_004364295.1 hypothetical protein CAOG_03456 [Capsaspora owczarzaki ATCC 30864]
MKAVVLGGTGACGKAILASLLSSSAVERVVTIGRRPVTVPDQAQLEQSGKLVQVTTEMAAIAQAEDAFKGADVVMCAFGTTRKQAGSAEAFKKIDQEYVVAAAATAKRAGVPHFMYISSHGASASSWFLYLQSKGQTENGIIAQKFDKVSILRPGLLDRGDESRFVEKFAMVFTSGCKTTTIGEAMRELAAAYLTDKASSGDAVQYVDDATIRRLGKQ